MPGALGVALEGAIQQWVCRGRGVRVDESPWLAGPIGGERIGADFYETYARQHRLELQRDAPGAGLLVDFGLLAGPRFDPQRVTADVQRFYERTADYTLDVWSEWRGILRPFAHGLIALVSRDIEQFNLPLSPLDTSRGMTSEIIRLRDPRAGTVVYTGWLRRMSATDKVIYAGFYTTCVPPRAGGPCVKVVFPLPRGASIVILRPENLPDGSFRLISDGAGFGDAGYYRVHEVGPGELRVRYVPVKELIHVYRDARGMLRTDHLFRFWRIPFLALHYKIARASPPS